MGPRLPFRSSTAGHSPACASRRESLESSRSHPRRWPRTRRLAALRAQRLECLALRIEARAELAQELSRLLLLHAVARQRLVHLIAQVLAHIDGVVEEGLIEIGSRLRPELVDCLLPLLELL